MIKYMVIGDPVAHSRSPGMQNAAFEFHGLGSPYGRQHVRPEELPEFLDFARRKLKGFNLTVPHKAAVIPFLDEISPDAAAAGSVNTVTVEPGGRLRGESTDGFGLEGALLQNFSLKPQGKTFCFAGCGGAAHATAFHLAMRGAKRIFLANRTLAKAEELAKKLQKFAPQVTVAVAELKDTERLREFFCESDALIQATSLGLHPDDPAPFALELFTANPQLAVFDTIYHPTPVQLAAKQAGLPVADGRWMLIYQGAKSFESWTGLPAPLEAMRHGFEEVKSC